MTRAEVERAFTAHKDAVYRFAWRMAPDAADEVAQDVFVRLLRGQIQFDERRGSLRSFLLAVARNLALQHLRSSGRCHPGHCDDRRRRQRGRHPE